MASRKKELQNTVKRVLDEFGATSVSFGTAKSGHQMALFTLHGTERRFKFASSPSDFKTVVYTRTLLRRLCRGMTNKTG